MTMNRFLPLLLALALVGCTSNTDATTESGQITRTGMVAVPGGNVFYEISNPDADGIPLLLIHGGPGGTSCGFGLLDNEILDRPVIRYDQLETGRSERPGLRDQWNIAHSVAEIEAIRAGLGLEKVHLMGWSWGGSVAAEYVLEGSDEGLGAVIMSGPLLSTPAWIDDAKALVATMPEDLQEVIRRHEGAGTYDDPQYIAATDSFYARFMDPIGYPPIPECDGVSGNMDVYTTMWGPTEFTATGTLLNYDRTDRLGEIDVPVLIVAGEFDEARPVTLRGFADMMPDARVEVIPGAGHAAPAERPADIAKLVSDFLAAVEAGEASN